MATAREIPTPLAPPWGDRPVNFLRDIQPVLDRHCVRCHSGLKPAGSVDLFGGLISHDGEIPGYGHNRAYETILEKKLVSVSAVRAQDASITPPLAYGSLKSKLLTCLADTNHTGQVQLPDEDRLRLAMWIDANAPYHDTFVNKRPDKPAYSLPGDRPLLESLTALQAKRCGGCHKPGQISRLDWIDIYDPARSLFLTSPLSKESGGSGKCGKIVFKDRNDADYQAVFNLVAASVDKTWENRRRDLVCLERQRSPSSSSQSASEIPKK